MIKALLKYLEQDGRVCKLIATYRTFSPVQAELCETRSNSVKPNSQYDSIATSKYISDNLKSDI